MKPAVNRNNRKKKIYIYKNKNKIQNIINYYSI